MGFSTSIASVIILIGLISFAAASVGSMMYVLNAANLLMETADQTANVQLELNVTEVNVTEGTIIIRFTLRNSGSKPIFLVSRNDYNWNSVVISYYNQGRHIYLIENFKVSEIRVQDSNVSFDPSNHKFINPGEEAFIEVDLPGSVEIPINGVVTVVFISHYGVSAMEEAVRD